VQNELGYRSGYWNGMHVLGFFDGRFGYRNAQLSTFVLGIYLFDIAIFG
jgi:hypothetical protein